MSKSTKLHQQYEYTDRSGCPPSPSPSSSSIILHFRLRGPGFSAYPHTITSTSNQHAFKHKSPRPKVQRYSGIKNGASRTPSASPPHGIMPLVQPTAGTGHGLKVYKYKCRYDSFAHVEIGVLCDARTIPSPHIPSRFTNGRVLVRETTFYPPPSAAHIRSHHIRSRFIDVG